MRKKGSIPPVLSSIVEKVRIASATGIVDALSLRRLERLAKRLKGKRKRNRKRGIRREEKLRRESEALRRISPELES